MKSVLKTLLSVFLILFIIFSIEFTTITCAVIVMDNAVRENDKDLIVIFNPDGSTIEGLGHLNLWKSNGGKAYVRIDDMEYITSYSNLLIVHTPTMGKISFDIRPTL